MAESGQKSNTGRKKRRRSKSVTSERVRTKSDSHPYELHHSVSLSEKQGIVKKKNKKQLEIENIALDSAKHIVEKQLIEVKAENDKLKEENAHLKQQFDKSEKEKTKIYDEMEMMKRETSNLKTDFDKEKALLREEKSSLTAQLGKSWQGKQDLRKTFDEEKAKLEEEIRKKMEELTNLKTDFDNEKALLRDEKSNLTAKLDKSRQEKQTLKKTFIQEKAKLEEEKRTQVEELTNERKQRWEHIHNLSKLLEDSRAKVFITGSCENVQVGEANIVEQALMAEWKELADKLCVSIDEHMNKRKELEMKARNDQVLLKEINDTLNKVLGNLDRTTSKRLGQDKDLLEFLTYDRSDERIFTDGIKQLKKHIAGSKSRKNFPLAAEAAVARLLNKFDNLTCKQFVEVLEGKKQTSAQLVAPDDADQTEKKEVYVEKMESIQLGESDKAVPLNRSFCIDILVQWLHLSEENDAEHLLGRIKVYESKLSAEIVLEYQEEIKRKRITSSLNEMQILKEDMGPNEGFEVLYSRQPKTQSLRGLPDALSQFMHQLEGLKIVIDIDKKVDEVCNVLKTRDDATEKANGNKKESRFNGTLNRQFSDV